MIRASSGRSVASTPARVGVPTPGQLFSRVDLLRWIYLGRLTLVSGILAGVLWKWNDAGQQAARLAVIMFLVALLFTTVSFWYTHVVRREPNQNFLYPQVILDVLLVTGIVHITNGPDSSFAPLYILVISAGALLLPLPGGVLIGGLASMVYFGDLVWGYEGAFSVGVGLQIGLFAVVALLTGLVGDRLRRSGIALGAVESELRQLRLETGDILATLATGVLTVDGEGRLAYANPAAEALLDVNAGEWLGRPVVDEMERKAPGLGWALRQALEERRPLERQRTIFQRNGKEVRLGVSTTVVERGEREAPSATAIFQDITDLELIEALNRRAERLEAVAALSASLAHEIKNPLASIRSAVEQLSRSTLGEGDRAILQRLVLTESDRLSRLLSEFLDYSGLRMGSRRTVDLGSVVADCATLIRQHPDAEGVEVRCEGDAPAVKVDGDEDLLHRALFNLMLNGVQYAGGGGWVSVSIADLQERPNPRGTGLRHPVSLTVRDSGPGVDPEAQERIFDPFFTTRGGGSGLGLAVVFRAVEAHKGAIFANRAPEGGAEFVIYLPAAEVSDGGEAS